MNYSTNYNLNLVEGTDLMNPLVVDVPNYTAIDTAMAANRDNGIPLATEVVTGTSHAITRSVTSAPVFRFVATGNFVAGDTFTVDGTACTAIYPNGEALEDNAYVVGSVVIASLQATQLTIYASKATADNSYRLGGQLPSYYASASDMTSAESRITALEDANDVEDVTTTWNGMTIHWHRYGKVCSFYINGSAPSVNLNTAGQYHESPIPYPNSRFAPVSDQIKIGFYDGTHIGQINPKASGIQIGYCHTASTEANYTWPSGRSLFLSTEYIVE